MPHVCPSGLRLEEEGGSVRTSALFSGGLHTCRVNPVSAQRVGHLNSNSRQGGTAQAHVEFGPSPDIPVEGRVCSPGIVDPGEAIGKEEASSHEGPPD